MRASHIHISRRKFLGLSAGSVAAACFSGKAGAQDDALSEPLFAFGALTDIQHCDCDAAGSRYYRASPAKAEACVKDFNSQDLAFVIQLGDFIDRDFASFANVLPIYNKLAVPHYHVLGNHDFAVEPDKKAAMLSKLGLAKRYYDFTHGGWRFVVLDGNDVSVYGRPEGSPQYMAAQATFGKLKKAGARNAQTWNGAVGKTQLAWLEATLADASREGQRAIVFCHLPVCPENEHNLWNDFEIMDLMAANECVAAYINGHNHAGNYAEKDGVHYLTLHGMVETPDTTAYAVVEVYRDHLRVIGHGREPDRVLRLRQG